MTWRFQPMPISVLSICAMVALIGISASGASHAARITAESTSTKGLSDPQDDRMDPDVWWSSGTFVITTEAFASDAFGHSESSNRWPSEGDKDKEDLLEDVDPTTAGPPDENGKPTSIIPGSNVFPASGSGADYAASGVESPQEFARGYAYGYAYLDTTLVNEYEMVVHSYADSTLHKYANMGSAKAEITDPFRFGWNDDEDHTLISTWHLEPGTALAVDQASPEEGEGSAAIMAQSDMTIRAADDTLLGEQLYWSVSISANSVGDQLIDVMLGDGVYLFGNPLRGEKLIEAIALDLNTYWTEAGFFSIPTDLFFPFAYDVSIGEPGYIDFTHNVEAIARTRAVPNPSSMVLLAAGLVGVWRRASPKPTIARNAVAAS